MMYRPRASNIYGHRRGLPGKSDPEKKREELDKAWRLFLATRSKFLKGEIGRKELDEALERLKKVARRAGVRILNEDGLAVRWAEETVQAHPNSSR
jgi:hypothetical protein